MLNVNGCSECIYFTKGNKCSFEKSVKECLEKGECDFYEEKDIDRKLLEVIKQKVDEATPKELNETLEYINKQLTKRN